MSRGWEAGPARPAYREEAPYKIHGGCGLVGICDQTGAPLSAEVAIRAMAAQRDRGNGLGGGFAGYGIYPDYADHYCLHVMYHDERARAAAEGVIGASFVVDQAEPIPTRPVEGIVDPPLLWRYFVLADEARLHAAMQPADDLVVRTVMHINTTVDGAFVASSGKNMGAFKGVGFPEEIAAFFRLEEYRGHTWLGHNRFPTNTPGWWGGAHPFVLLDWAVVHNGELSSYGINRRYLEQFGYRCALGTDTEVAAYLFDLLLRRHELPLELACMALASPLWSEIDRMPPAQREMAQALRVVYGSAMLNGPFAMVLGFNGGMVALNDRIKLRPLVAARQGELLMVASEESVLHEVLEAPDAIWAPRAGEPLVAHVKGMPWPIPGDRGHAPGGVSQGAGAPPAGLANAPCRLRRGRRDAGTHGATRVSREGRRRALPQVRPLRAAVRLGRVLVRRAAHPRPRRLPRLPPLRHVLPGAGHHHREEPSGLPREPGVAGGPAQGNLAAGRDGRRAAHGHGQRPALPEHLRPPRARRLPGHQPVHRPAARAHGAAHLPGRQAGQGGG